MRLLEVPSYQPVKHWSMLYLWRAARHILVDLHCWACVQVDDVRRLGGDLRSSAAELWALVLMQGQVPSQMCSTLLSPRAVAMQQQLQHKQGTPGQAQGLSCDYDPHLSHHLRLMQHWHQQQQQQQQYMLKAMLQEYQVYGGLQGLPTRLVAALMAAYQEGSGEEQQEVQGHSASLCFSVVQSVFTPIIDLSLSILGACHKVGGVRALRESVPPAWTYSSCQIKSRRTGTTHLRCLMLPSAL
jgi:hypothetical protein